MEINHKENIDMIKALNNNVDNRNIKILPFIPVKYAYEDIKDDDIFKDILLFADILKVKIIPVKRMKSAGLYFSNKEIFINVKSYYPLFYVVGHEVSHMLEGRYVDYVLSMRNIISKYEDIGDINDKNIKYKKIIRYFKYLIKDYNFQYDRYEFNMLSLMFELVGDILGELWLQYDFWDMVKVGASDRLIELVDLGIEIAGKEKRIVSEWDSVLDMFDEGEGGLDGLNGLRCEVVEVFRRNLEVYMSECGVGV